MKYHKTHNNHLKWVVILFMGCSSAKTIVATQASIVVDGKLETNEHLSYYDTASHLIYDVALDSNYLFVQIEILDKMKQLLLLKNGFNIWFSAVGRRCKSSGIRFPYHTKKTTPQPPERDYSGKGQSMPNIENMLDKMVSMAKLEGLGGEEQIIFMQHNLTDIECALGYDKSTKRLIYESRISLALINSGISTEKLSRKDLAVGLEFNSESNNGMSRPIESSRGGTTRGRSGSMGTHGKMPGGKGGMSDGSPSGGMVNTTPSVVWLKIQDASN